MRGCLACRLRWVMFPGGGGGGVVFGGAGTRLLLEEGVSKSPFAQEPLVNVYPVPLCAASLTADGGEVPGGGGLMVAVRLADVVPPLRNGRPLGAGDRSALVVGGTERIRTGDAVVFLKAVAVAPARGRRAGGGGGE